MRGRIAELFYSFEGVRVKRAKLYEFYKLGALQGLRELQLEEGQQIGLSDIGYGTIFYAHMVTGDFISNEENAVLPGAIAAAQELQTENARLLRLIHNDKKLTQQDVLLLPGKLLKFEHLLENDLARLPTFSVERTGIFDSTDLITRADNHLSDVARANISTNAKMDFQASGRCLAFGEFTASGFHAVRALESVARKYHSLVCKLAAETENLPLGPLVNDLRKVLEKEEGKNASDSPLGLIIANLARMNNIYRKPITHPEMTLDSADAAKEVFDLTAVSISLLEKDFVERVQAA